MRRSRTGVNRLLVAAATLASLGYLAWRLGWTLGGPWWLSLPLFAAEALLVLRFLLGVTTTVVAPTRRSDPASVCDTGDGPDVELLVPAGLADRDELVRTLLVASVGTAARIRVLDHRDRPRIRRTAERLGAEYEVHQIPAGSRPAALIEAARAGSRAEVLAWVDAGDVIVPGFLDLASMLVDPARPRLAVVQSSVDLINPDSLLHLSPGRDERALDNEVVGPSLSRSGAAEWIGTGSLFRADAIESIGGLTDAGAPTHRAAMRLARSGWGVRWSTPPSVRTEAPDSLDAYLLAEGTAAHEDWTLLASAESPLAPVRTGARRRAAQLHASTAVLDGLARLTALSVLVATLVTGLMPVSGPLLVVAAAFCAQLALRTAAAVSLGRGTVGIGDTTRHGLRTMGVHVLGLVRRPRYPVTAHKGGLATLGRLRLTTTMLVLVDLALFARVLTFALDGLLPHFDTDAARFLAMAAAVWTIVAMVDVLHLLVGRVQRRSAHRQVTDLVAELDGQHCKVVDLTPRGIGLLIAERPGGRTDAGPVTARLDIPRLDGTTTQLSVRLRIRHVADQVDADSGRHRAGASFVGLDDDARDVLTEYCALTAEQRDLGRDRVASLTPDDLSVAGPRPARRALAVGNVAAVLVAGLVVAAGPAGAAPLPGGGGDATLTGRVLDPSGEPYAGACVETTGGPLAVWTNTDSDGEFTLTGLSDGTYKVAATDCGRNVYARTYAASEVARADATAFAVSASATVAVGDIRLRELGSLTGSVVDERGAPLADICAHFVIGPPEDQEWVQFARTDALGAFTGTVPADVDGAVRLDECSATPRVVDAWLPNVSDLTDAQRVRVDARSSVDLGTTTLSDGAIVQGTVTDTSGVPQQNVCVSAQEVSGRDWIHKGGASTDADGHFEFLTAPGTYAIWMNDCGSGSDLMSQWYRSTPSATNPIPTVDVTPGGVTLDDSMRRGGRASGRLLDSQGRPAIGACVSLHDTTNIRGGSSTWDPVQADGTWLSSPVGAGDYLVQYTNCNGSEWIEQIRSGLFTDVGRPWSLADADPIRIESGRTIRDVDDVAVRGVNMSGTVRYEGAPVAGVCVGGVGGRDSITQTDGDGRWQATVLPDADVALTFSDCLPGRGLVQQQRTTPAGDTTVDVDMAHGGTSSITGSVRNDASAIPSVPTCVVAYVPDHLIGMAQVDPDGTFHVDGLADGDYWIGFFGCGADSDQGDEVGPISFPGDPTAYPPTWFPGIPIRLEMGSPHPGDDGVPAVQVRSAHPAAPLDLCLGGGCTTTTTTPTTPSTPTTSVDPSVEPPAAPNVVPPAAPTPARPGGAPKPTRFTFTSNVANARPLPTSTPRRPVASTTITAGSNASTTTAAPAASAASAAADDAPTTIASPDPATIQATGDEVAALEPLTVVPPDQQGFPWDLLGATALVAAAAIALIVVWHRRHPAMG